MTLTIDLPPVLEKDVRPQAARRGQPINEFVVQAIEAQLTEAETCDATVEKAPMLSRGRRGYSADEVIAMLQMPQPVPDDVRCQEIVEEELLRKYGK